MKIEVTHEHIKNGLPRCADKCPVALALQGAGFELAQASFGGLWFKDHFYGVPRDVWTFMRHFDWGLEVEPITFELLKAKEET